MNTTTFKAYFFKESLDSKRNYKYLLLGIGLLMFAVLDPLSLKLLPLIIGNKAQVDLSNFTTKMMGIQSYIKDLSQIGFMFVIFSIAGTVSDELRNQRFVIPYSKGASPTGMLLAKTVHYFLTVFVFLVIGYALNYYYVSILLKGADVDLLSLFLSMLLMSAYYLFYINYVIMLSTIFKKGVSAGMICLLTSMILGILSFAKATKKCNPSYIYSCASDFNFYDVLPYTILVVGFSLIFVYISIKRLNNIEVN